MSRTLRELGSTIREVAGQQNEKAAAELNRHFTRMRRFESPEEFLVSLRSAEILRRPKSLAYLQGLKWVAQAKERVR